MNKQKSVSPLLSCVSTRPDTYIWLGERMSIYWVQKIPKPKITNVSPLPFLRA